MPAGTSFLHPPKQQAASTSGHGRSVNRKGDLPPCRGRAVIFSRRRRRIFSSQLSWFSPRCRLRSDRFSLCWIRCASQSWTSLARCPVSGAHTTGCRLLQTGRPLQWILLPAPWQPGPRQGQEKLHQEAITCGWCLYQLGSLDVSQFWPSATQ